jgi:hypothetical protein
MRTGYEEFEEKLHHHPSEDLLSDYYHGRLNDVDHLTVQCHLIDCDGCARVLRDVSDFCDSADDSPIVMSKAESEQVWRNVRQGVKSDSPTGILSTGKGPKILLTRWAVFATAAVALVLLVTAGAWVMRLRQDNDKLAEQAMALTRQLEETEKELNSRIEELEKEPVRQEQAQETVQDDRPREARPAPLNLNVPVYNVYSTEWVRRSGEEAEANRIKLSPRDESIVLILVGEDQQGASNHRIEIIDPKGQSVRHGGRLLKNSYGNFVISLSRDFLRPGTYRIRTRSQGGSAAEQVTEYMIRVE